MCSFQEQVATFGAATEVSRDPQSADTPFEVCRRDIAELTLSNVPSRANLNHMAQTVKQILQASCAQQRYSERWSRRIFVTKVAHHFQESGSRVRRLSAVFGLQLSVHCSFVPRDEFPVDESFSGNLSMQSPILLQQVRRAALRETEGELHEAIEHCQQVIAELNRRLQEQSRELAEQEQRFRELRAELRQVEQKERQRLAELLHVQVQQLLVAARLRVDIVAGKSPEPTRTRLGEVMQILGDAIQATRNLSAQLSPPLLHEQGLAAALMWLAERLSNLHGLVIQHHCDPAADPGCETGRDVLYHSAHELLLNALKHSGACEIRLSLRRENDGCRLEIVDQGVGFDLPRSIQQGSFGLIHLRQRLERAGGTLRIDSAPGKGTRVVATLPVD
jgi:signal transduction histidine kinase